MHHEIQVWDHVANTRGVNDGDTTGLALSVAIMLDDRLQQLKPPPPLVKLTRAMDSRTVYINPTQIQYLDSGSGSNTRIVFLGTQVEVQESVETVAARIGDPD